MVFLLAELVIRATAQGGERFFIPRHNKFEVMMLCVGITRLTYATFFQESILAARMAYTPMGWLTAVLLIWHRLIRCAGIRYRVSANAWEASSVIDAHAVELVQAMVGDI